MDLKDWLTLGTSWAALGIAAYSLFRTIRRDRIDARANEPAIDINMDRCQGYGPWDVHISIANRLDCRIDIEGIFLPEDGALRLVERLRTKTESLRNRFSASRKLTGNGGHRGLSPGSTLSDLIYLEPTNGAPLKEATPVEFIVLYRKHDDMRRLHRRVMRMTATP
ncbi:hypothetical protein E8E01_15050 [Methylorubrum populi]|uniref:hypothetical protein n=2 Tax=Methylorubrum populi TaxID=223967 RepID=UPI00115085E2|nr:hypothetical protein [Methylorubrum populi]QDI81668.1 hypothetical protein E8E01_15050 [Methylorubrum populi]